MTISGWFLGFPISSDDTIRTADDYTVTTRAILEEYAALGPARTRKSEVPYFRGYKKAKTSDRKALNPKDWSRAPKVIITSVQRWEATVLDIQNDRVIVTMEDPDRKSGRAEGIFPMTEMLQGVERGSLLDISVSSFELPGMRMGSYIEVSPLDVPAPSATELEAADRFAMEILQLDDE